MYNCIAPLSRFYYPETQRLINDFIIIINVVWPSVSQAELAPIQYILLLLDQQVSRQS